MNGTYVFRGHLIFSCLWLIILGLIPEITTAASSSPPPPVITLQSLGITAMGVFNGQGTQWELQFQVDYDPAVSYLQTDQLSFDTLLGDDCGTTVGVPFGGGWVFNPVLMLYNGQDFDYGSPQFPTTMPPGCYVIDFWWFGSTPQDGQVLSLHLEPRSYVQAPNLICTTYHAHHLDAFTNCGFPLQDRQVRLPNAVQEWAHYD